jgi:hypothetical protein
MAFAKTARRTNNERPWWLEDGAENCPACSHTYVIQTEYRCVACDGPLCSLCVTSVFEAESSCPDCVSPEVSIER